MADYPEGYAFIGGYPTPGTIQRAYDDADLNRAVQCYRFFYPTVSIMATWQGNLDNGVIPNEVFPLLEGTPQQLVFTPNSDTPYAAAALDLTDGPMVVELPPGPLMCTSNDLNQRWIMDMGLPGPDGDNGDQSTSDHLAHPLTRQKPPRGDHKLRTFALSAGYKHELNRLLGSILRQRASAVNLTHN
jgi:hypothetical protein